MRVKPARLSIRKGFVQTRHGTFIPAYFASYRGLLLGDWVHYGGGDYFFLLPNGKVLYRGVGPKALVFRDPKPRLHKRTALVRSEDLRKATLSLLKRDLI